MTTLTTEETGTATATATAQPKAATKARVARQRAHAAPKKAKSRKKANPAKRAPKGARKAGARDGSKTATILEMLKRTGGATAKELLKATGWMPHSLRGFISGTLGKKMGLTVVSTKGEDGERSYSVKG
ncbi:MAG TPA: DUF3489 domain-containing protein [Bryobacteraceae bacterium]|nr:DUF3489 domain-containing protein [Bryobacteraceae bacterium]